ncbi:hypothetical protein BaRGS_00006912 [Batillaria attramentaria]|uniref:Secreted protein n=1 Tax=Batillaria attramentaria TaxID=370345 RepID=A0ABD0LRM7_9CAEN
MIQLRASVSFLVCSSQPRLARNSTDLTFCGRCVLPTSIEGGRRVATHGDNTSMPYTNYHPQTPYLILASAASRRAIVWEITLWIALQVRLSRLNHKRSDTGRRLP